MYLQKIKIKNIILVDILKVTDENGRIRIHWSDPDPYQN